MDTWRIIIPRKRSLTSGVPASIGYFSAHAFERSKVVQQTPQAVTGTCLFQKCWRFIYTWSKKIGLRDLIRHYFPTNFIPISSEFQLLLQAGCCKLLSYHPCLVFRISCWQMAVPSEQSPWLVAKRDTSSLYCVLKITELGGETLM